MGCLQCINEFRTSRVVILEDHFQQSSVLFLICFPVEFVIDFFELFGSQHLFRPQILRQTIPDVQTLDQCFVVQKSLGINRWFGICEYTSWILMTWWSASGLNNPYKSWIKLNKENSFAYSVYSTYIQHTIIILYGCQITVSYTYNGEIETEKKKELCPKIFDLWWLWRVDVRMQ